MLYDLRLTIEYRYDASSDRTRNILRLLPGDVAGVQRLVQRRLTIEPQPQERRDGRDFFGNETCMVAWHRPIDALMLHLSARIERFEPAPLLDLSPPLEELHQELIQMASIAPGSPHHFVAASPRVRLSPKITDYGWDCLETTAEPGVTVLKAVETLGRALHRDMSFDPEATDVDTSPEEAFENRHGVCQDFAHVMIAALRGIGIPAGYVSGFLRTFPPPGQPRLEGADAMHAWVRAWAGKQLGWVEFDPTNNQFAGSDYITLGHGRDYGDVAPVRGALRSSGGQDSEQAVDVLPLEISAPR
ncbi:transglutaminase family protein [Celeribacter neptunius]|uniref:Transglutaminase-like enzyme, putative cysteine protease n=1 Tax=Celeribacter neptunius TaxID=588602 RepID=A0A1I3WT26_9RHOB|nr:transglutaminase family protein [Celeribacter neptunius]SFK10698.1 Transglutaminase-like enzyme, putative cysteine protease [Celeribacter neptunius]